MNKITVLIIILIFTLLENALLVHTIDFVMSTNITLAKIHIFIKTYKQCLTSAGKRKACSEFHKALSFEH